ncbi:MAG: hypothetical protein MUO67_23510 [Anaerolineales bacterium]|nr:hypothetical protein [Anaerolineales bacterium]
MDVNTPNKTLTSLSERGTEESTRLHYLDWLQVLAVLGVYLFHAVHAFDDLADWHIKNVDKSVLGTFFVGFFQSLEAAFFRSPFSYYSNYLKDTTFTPQS